MLTHDEIISRARRTNPVFDVSAIPDELLEDITSLITEGRQQMPDVDTAPTTSIEPDTTRRRWRVAALAFSAAFAVALLIGAITLFLSGGDEPMGDTPTSTLPSAPTSTTPPTENDEAAAPTTTPTDPESVATPLELGALTTGAALPDSGAFGDGASIAALLTIDSTVVAVGSTGAWTSNSGTEWVRSTVEGAAVWMWDVIAEDGLVAVGTRSDGSRTIPSVWTSADGTRWSLATADDAFGQADFDVSALRAVVAFDGGYVSGGGSCPDADSACPYVPTIWTSDDLLSWERQILGEQLGLVADVITVDGRLLAATNVIDDEGTEDVVLWTSANGVEWLPVAQSVLDELVFGDGGNVEGNQWVEALATDGTTIVAVGAAWDFASDSTRGTVWTSTACQTIDAALQVVDGAYCWSWYQPNGLYLDAVAVLGDEFVLGGHFSAEPGHGFLWRSTDGNEFLPIDVDRSIDESRPWAIAIQPRAFVSLGDQLIVGGLAIDQGPVWIGRTDG